MTPTLPNGLYPFHENRIPLSEMAMIEAPADLQMLFVAQAERQGVTLIRGEPVELRCPSESAPDSAFLIFWPSGEGPLHMLAPKQFSKGRA